MKKQIVVDFDNTMGVRQCDVDDGLALLMLLGNPDLCEVKGLCTTYGNSTIDVTYANTLRMRDELQLIVPVLQGAASAAEPASDAGDFLAKITSEDPGEISVLATGSLTNMRGASLADPNFTSNVKEFALMGGVLSALCINGKIMDELNFSCDPEATLLTLNAPCPVMDAVSQHCLPCFFTRDELVAEFGADSWLLNACNNWFSTMDEWYDWGGFTVWDLVAATYLIRPDLFEDNFCEITLYPRWLSVGLLETQHMEGCKTATVNLPTIKDVDALKAAAFQAWHNVLDPLSL